MDPGGGMCWPSACIGTGVGPAAPAGSVEGQLLTGGGPRTQVLPANKGMSLTGLAGYAWRIVHASVSIAGLPIERLLPRLLCTTCKTAMLRDPLA